MPDRASISGWLFIDQETNTVMFVSRTGRSDDTGLPWSLLADEEILQAFRRDFAFKEVEIGGFLRFKVECPEASIRTWLSIREELK